MAYTVLYSLSLIMLIFIFIRTVKDDNIKLFSRKALIFTTTATIILATADLVSYYCNIGIINSDALNKVSLFFYFSELAIVAFAIFLLLGSLDEPRYFKNLKCRHLLSIPCYIFVLLAFISIFTGWIFGIENHKYVRGPINWLQFIIVLFYLLIGLGRALVRAFDKKYYEHRGTNISVIIYSLIPVIAGAAQVVLSIKFDEDLPIIVAGITISTIILYIQLVLNQISSDYLTGIGNKTGLFKHLNQKMNKHNETVFFWMIDIDEFKAINDQYGHVEGDSAILIVGECLYELTKKFGCYCARYGGDEFSIIVDTNEAHNLIIINEFNNMIKERSINKPYKLVCSAGYVALNDSLMSIPDIINIADRNMYVEKQKHYQK